jgi:hypothetical protein
MEFELYPRTKERLFEIAAKWGMSDKQFLTFIKAKKLPIPFDPGKWDNYLIEMTGHRGCPICGDLKKGKKNCWVCSLYPIHSQIMKLVPYFRRMKPEMSVEQVIRANLLDVCSHNRYTIECEECFDIYKAKVAPKMEKFLEP